MNFYIRAIILWPAQPQHGPRVIELKAGAINVLPGENRTGKTSVVSILEYCLGHDGCSVPRQPLLRDAVSWYGIIANFGTEHKFGHDVLIARRSPGTQDDKSNDFHMEEGAEGEELQVPGSLAVNTSRSRVLARLAELSGISNVNLLESEGALSHEEKEAVKEITFFDSLPFCLLPNDVLASPYELFFLRHVRGQALKRILPLAIGAVDDDIVQLSLQVQTHRSKRSEVKRERDRYSMVARNIHAVIFDVVSRAVALRLLPDEDRRLSPIEALPRLQMLLAKKAEIMADAQRYDEQQATPAQVTELAKLRTEEVQLSSEIEALRTERNQLAFLREQIAGYQAVLREQRGRAAGLAWFNERLADVGVCPTCGAMSALAVNEVRELGRALNWLRQEADKVALPYLGEEDAIRARLKQIEREERKLMERRRSKGVSIDVLRRNIPGLEAKVAPSAEASRAELFALLQLAIGQAHEVERFARLERQYQDEDRQIRDTTEDLKALNLRQRKVEAIRTFERVISHWASQFGLPRAEDDIRFVESSLSLKFVDGVERRLAELGSSENYMGYHVAVFLALHERFRETALCPVPSFVLFDSPSNVDAGRGVTAERGDAGAVLRRVYRGIDDAVREAAGGLQVIVTERPGLDEIWSGLKTAYIVPDWNGRLVPESWGSGQ